jgi:Inorganic Pyrophosphatase
MNELTDDQFMNLGAPPPAEMSDEQFMSLGSQPKDQPLTKQDLAGQAVSNPDTGLAARLTAYGANAASQIPGLKELGSAEAAALGAGQGNTFGERYADLEASQKAMREAGKKTDPGATTLGDISSNVLGIGLGGKLASEFAPGKVAALENYAKAHPYLASEAVGVPTSALYGFANGDDAASRISNAGVSAGIAAVASPLVTAASRNIVEPAVGKLVESARNLIGGEDTGAVAQEAEPALTKTQSKAQNILKQALKSEGIAPEDVADSLEAGLQTGKPLTALDVATKEKGGVLTQGRNLIGLTKAAATFPGEASSLSGDVSARGISAADRIGQDFDNAVSDNPFYGVKDQVVAQKQLASPYYKQFYDANQSMQSPLIDRILARPAGKAALQNVAEDMQNAAARMANPDPELMEQAKDAGLYLENGVGTGLKGQTLDYVKQDIDAQAQAAKRAYLAGNGSKREWNTLSQMAADLRNEMDRLDVTAQAGPNSLKPEGGAYARARSLSAQGFQVDDALEQGRNFMKQDPEEIKAFFNDPNTSHPEKAAYLAGQRRALQDMADNKNLGANPISSFTKPAIAKRLQASLGDSYGDLAKNLQLEGTMARINQVHTGGSDTMLKSNYGDMINSQPSNIVGRIAHAISSPGTAAANEGINLLSGALKKSAQKMDAETAAEIMRYMTANDADMWRGLSSATKTLPSPTSSFLAPLAGVEGENALRPSHKSGGRTRYKSGGSVSLEAGRSHGDTGINKSALDGILTDIKLFGNKSNAFAIHVHGFDSLDRQRKHMVLSHVLRLLHKKKVLRTIIESIPIDVMDGLIGRDWSPNDLLHDPSMLTHRLSISRNVPVVKPIIRFINALSSIVHAISTDDRTEESGLSRVHSSTPKFSLTKKTDSQSWLNALSTAKVPSESSSDFGGNTREFNPASITHKIDDRHVALSNGDYVNVKPSEAQKQSGSYKKGHVKVYGLDIAIENPKGSIRRGVDKDGKKWNCRLSADYGYFKGTKSADGDHVDCYLGPKLGSTKAYVIDQIDRDTGRFDESKVMLGYMDKESALKAYESSFSDGKGKARIGAVTELKIPQLKEWLKNGNTKKPVKMAA